MFRRAHNRAPLRLADQKSQAGVADMRILDHRALKDRGVSFTSVHLLRLEKLGRFPKRVRVGENRVGWIEAEIDQYLRERIAVRDSPPRPRGWRATDDPTPPRRKVAKAGGVSSTNPES
jgi:prophage regulatory protein